MPESPLVFAILSGVAVATYSVSLKLGSVAISPPVGGMVISVVALLANLTVLLVMRAAGQEVVFTPRSLGLVALAGVAAAGIDLFGILAFARGLNVSSSLVITGTQLSFVLLAGFLFLGEPFSWTRVGALGLIAAGIVVLARQGV